MPKSSLSLRCPRRTLIAAAALATPFVLVAVPLRAGEPPLLPLHMFVTSTAGNGDFSTAGSWAETEGSGLSGLAAADKICQVRAEIAGLASAGTPAFRAWVSIAGTDAYCHVLGLAGTRLGNCLGSEPFPSPGPWYRTDGVPFTDNLQALASGTLGTASRSESGVFVPSIAWTGSNGDGTATGSTCSSWGSASGFGSVGSTTSEKFWGEIALDGTFGCGNSAHLYCFQSPVVAPPRPAWPEPAALVFVRTGGGSGNLIGLISADVTCQEQAHAAGLPDGDSFRAWLSDDANDAKDRLTINGPWYRTDGVRVAASKAALIDGNLDSAINLIPNGAQLSAPDRVWTGTFGGGTKSANNCNDWFSFDAGLSGTLRRTRPATPGLRRRTSPTPATTPAASTASAARSWSSGIGSRPATPRAGARASDSFPEARRRPLHRGLLGSRAWHRRF